MQEGAFASTAPFSPEPDFKALNAYAEQPLWSGDQLLVLHGSDGHLLIDLRTFTRRTVRHGPPRDMGYALHGYDILPVFVGNEYFFITDGSSRNVRAVNIDTGATRVAVRGVIGRDYPVHLYVSQDGREIAREFTTKASATSRFVFASTRDRRNVQLGPDEYLRPLFSAESFALSSKSSFLALHKRPDSSRSVVLVDAATLKWKDLRKLKPDGLVGPPLADSIGVSPDGARLQWTVDYAPLPSVTFTKHAPRRLVRYVKRFPHAVLALQSQSRDGSVRVFKVTESSGRTHFVRLGKGALTEMVVPCKQKAKGA
jgi:hypothetical protein